MNNNKKTVYVVELYDLYDAWVEDETFLDFEDAKNRARVVAANTGRARIIERTTIEKNLGEMVLKDESAAN